MSGPVSGSGQYFKIATTASPTTSIGQLRESSFEQDANIQEVTVAGDFYKDFLPTLSEGKLDTKVWWDPTDTVQSTVQTAYNNRTLLYWSYSPDGGSHHYDGQMYVGKVKLSSKPGGFVEADVSFQPTGAFSYT